LRWLTTVKSEFVSKKLSGALANRGADTEIADRTASKTGYRWRAMSQMRHRGVFEDKPLLENWYGAVLLRDIDSMFM